MNRLSVAFVAILTGACSPAVVGGDDQQPPGDDQQDPGPGGPDAMCPAVNFTAKAVTPSIQLLLDRSGSMAEAIGNTSRYAAIRTSLVDGTSGVVTKLQNKAYFGASLYSSDTPCPKLYTTAARTLNNFQQVKSLIDGQSPNGNTPTPPAIDQTVAYFTANPPPMGSPPTTIRWIREPAPTRTAPP